MTTRLAFPELFDEPLVVVVDPVYSVATDVTPLRRCSRIVMTPRSRSISVQSTVSFPVRSHRYVTIGPK
jgi:hypothetical protein